jgi:hypothetical protein
MGKNLSGFRRGVEFFSMKKHLPLPEFLGSSNTVIFESGFFFVIGIVKKNSVY